MNQKVEAFIEELVREGDGADVVPTPTPTGPASPPVLTLITSSPSAAQPADELAHPQPTRIDPLLILDEIATGIVEDAFYAWVAADPAKLTQAIVEMHAENLKYALRSAPIRAAAARVRFAQAYAATAFAGTAMATYDGASPRERPYMLAVATLTLSKDERMAARDLCGSATTPLGSAMKKVLRRIAPGGLETSSFALACAVLRSDLVTVGGRLAYSEMDENATIDGREVEDNDIAAIQERIDLAYGALGNTGPLRSMMDRAVNKVAMERPYHEVRDYMNALPAWDGKPRLKYVVRDLLRAELSAVAVQALSLKERRKAQERAALARRQIKKFFVGAVARTMRPGCKHDSILILKGDQGKQKSTWFRTITPRGRFSDADMDLQDKDSILELRKNFIFEWSELSTVRSAKDWEVVKGFTARQEDTVRPPYARRAMRRPRHCVIVGTTNEPEFLSDPTGSRRFWVIETGGAKIDLKKTEEQRDQLWAEALHLWKRGYRWWFDGKAEVLRETVNQQHSVPDPWQARIEEWLEHRAMGDVPPAPPSSYQIMSVALSMESAKQTQADSRHVGRVMRALGYTTRDCWDAQRAKSYKGWVKAQ